MNLVRCPTCHREFSWDSAASSRPFCSNRCKLIDLGAWASEQHAIPGDAATDNGDDRASSNQDNESDFE